MYNVSVSVKDNISEKEKTDRINQFRQAFVAAAANYYTNNLPLKPIPELKKVKESA